MRVTLDLDHTKTSIVKGKAKLLKIAYPSARVKWRTSSGGKGGHVLMYEASIDEDTMYNIRYLLGDHEKRISIDWGRGKFGNPMLPLQVLFDAKKRKCNLWGRCPSFDDRKCRFMWRAGEWHNV